MDPNTDNKDAKGDAPQNPGRRRLLKGGAAAGPLVLTLRGGGGGWIGSGTRCNFDKWGNQIKTKDLSVACKASLGLKNI